MTGRIENRFYREVAGNATLEDDYVIADGETLHLNEIGGNAAGIEDTLVKLVWDPVGENKTLLTTHGDTVQNAIGEYTGNGVKIIRTVLVNNSSLPQSLGAYFMGTQG
jgi:hypothetical protein